MIDKKLFNEGIKTVESELSDVKRQQQHWNKGHQLDFSGIKDKRY